MSCIYKLWHWHTSLLAFHPCSCWSLFHSLLWAKSVDYHACDNLRMYPLVFSIMLKCFCLRGNVITQPSSHPILTGYLKNDARIRNINKDGGSNDKGRTHLSIKIELALCLQLAQPMAIRKISVKCIIQLSLMGITQSVCLWLVTWVWHIVFTLPHMWGTHLHFCMK